MIKVIIFLLIISSYFLLIADFTELNWGARGMALGNAYCSLSDEPTTIFWNCAGMGKISHISLAVSHQNMYGINNFYNEMVAVVIPLQYVKIGLGYTQMNLWDVYSEQITYLSVSSIIWYRKIPLRFGVSGKHYLAQVKDYAEADSPQNFDCDISFDTNFSKNFTFSFITRNLLESSYKFINVAENINREYILSAAYKWEKGVNFTCDYIKNEQNLVNLGIEMWFYKVFAPRIGLRNGAFTTGFGLKHKQWQFDGAIFPQEELGSTYRLALIWKFGNLGL
ncbi:MAG: hypothetical protein K8S23_02395 [Candidatus Cloacimonetes bacterium]|nr:hypothetical protein [Candidatus Cloacimonadota bacterium]